MARTTVVKPYHLGTTVTHLRYRSSDAKIRSVLRVTLLEKEPATTVRLPAVVQKGMAMKPYRKPTIEDAPTNDDHRGLRRGEPQTLCFRLLATVATIAESQQLTNVTTTKTNSPPCRGWLL